MRLETSLISKTTFIIFLNLVALYYIFDLRNKKVFRPLEFDKSKNVVSMSLYGSNIRYTLGAIKNAMLVKTNFPGWTLRFYLENPNLNNSRHELVPKEIIYTLTHLDSELYYPK